MTKVVCNFNLFDIKHEIYVYENNNGAESYTPIGKCPLVDIGKIITDTCFALNINNVHLFGHSKYIEGVLEDIDVYSGCSAYSNGIIKVEVN